MQLSNNTHYFSVYTRTINNVPDKDSFAAESSKRVQLQQRLYWEQKDCEKHFGQAFFITFTYNDCALCTYDKYNVFNKKDIDLLTNGLIQKTLYRNYGSCVRYCIVPETGEGKGKRGLGNNPHLHAIFFVSPIRDKNNNCIFTEEYTKTGKLKHSAYQRITPQDFVELCRKVWQYKRVEYYEKGKRGKQYQYLPTDYKNARFGHVQPGDNYGLVSSSDCFSYVSKYITKDNISREIESFVKHEIYTTLSTNYITKDVLINYYHFMRDTSDSMYLLESDAKRHKAFYEYLHLDEYSRWRTKASKSVPHTYAYFVDNYLSNSDRSFLADLDLYFHRTYLTARTKELWRNWYNQYGAKVRTSKSLGIYGISQILAPSYKPHFDIYTSSDIDQQKISLYYFRKRYYNIFKCSITGNPLYYLNEDGINLQKFCLCEKIERYKSSIHKSLTFLYFNRESDIAKYVPSGLDTHSTITELKERLNDFHDSVLLAVYNCVYRFRHFVSSDFIHIKDTLDYSDVVKDYESFLRNTSYSNEYDDAKLQQVLKHGCFYSFKQLPVFKPILDYIEPFDILFTMFDNYQSTIRKKQFNDKKKTQYIVKRDKFNNI